MNGENLIKLAEHLEALPSDYSHFDMGVFFGRATGLSEGYELDYAVRNPTAIYDCGTVACAAGHGPAAGIPATSEDGEQGWFSWVSYIERAFGIVPHSEEFMFLFSGGWELYDNTHQGAAQRIRHLLAGNPPLEVGDLSYKEQA